MITTVFWIMKLGIYEIKKRMYLINPSRSLNVKQLFRIYEITVEAIYPAANARFAFLIKNPASAENSIVFIVPIPPINKNIINC